MRFGLSGVQVNPLLPFAAALGISTFTSMGGVSGTYILLPLQVSLLHFTGPAVTPTNHLINVLAIPLAMFRFAREGRLLWPLTSVIIAGTLPGVVLGTWLRVSVLGDVRRFKIFIGAVLLLLGAKMLQNCAQKIMAKYRGENIAEHSLNGHHSPAVFNARLSWRELSYDYLGRTYRASSWSLGLLTAAVGIIGGAYGMGGAAIIAPFLISVFKLPVHTIAGATLTGNFATSLFGVIFFTVLQPLSKGGPRLAPDWLLGGLFGLGGMSGMYLGARLQKKIPSLAIEILLCLITLAMALNYLSVDFLR